MGKHQSLRDFINIVEGVLQSDTNQNSVDPETEQLAELVSRWMDTDPLTTPGYSRVKTRLATSLLKLDHVAARYRTVPATHLFRAFRVTSRDLFALFGDPFRSKKPFPGELVISPRPVDRLTSWTADIDYAYTHGEQFENVVIIKAPTTDLDVFLNVDAFERTAGAGNFDHQEAEVIVRPATMTITREMIVDRGQAGEWASDTQ